MIRFFLYLPLFSLPLVLAGCTTHANVELNGIPKFIAGGAKISGEPEPLRPDPAIMHFEQESGPIELQIITDNRTYPKPFQKKKKVEKPIEYERGRDHRIRRLF